MKLDDFNSTFNSAKVSKVLEDKFGTRISLGKLNLKQLKSLKARVTEAHKKTVKSMPFNSGHRNPEYLEQVALLEAIELRINEVGEGFLGGAAGSALGGMVGGPVGALAGGYLGSKLTDKDDEKVKEVKDEEEDDDQDDKLSGSESSNLLRLVGSANMNKARRALELARQGKPISGNLVLGLKPFVDIVYHILKGGSSAVNRLKSLDKQIAHAAHLDESRYLAEGETEKAQLIMAVKDMVDRVQGMVEDLNKMKVEDLVALTDKMRDEFGQDQATSFTSGANDILSAGIDALTNARSELDNAVLGLTGEAPAATPGAGMAPGGEMPTEPGAEMPGAESGVELPAPEAGVELPAPEGGEEVGRELRESRKRARRRILESSRFLGKLAK